MEKDDNDTIGEQLRLQFQTLQEQQLQRLQERLVKKKYMDAQESLDLSGNDGDSVMDQSYSHSKLLKMENDQLLQRIREIRDENGRLHKLLSEKEFEIKYLKKKREEDRLALVDTEGLAGDAAATKIVLLSKKNRELSAEVEKGKSKSKELNNRVIELERKLRDALAESSGIKVEPKIDVKSPQQEAALLVKSQQEKLNVAEFKMSEYRNQIQALKQELKVAHKVLSTEVGEDVSIQQLLNTHGNWRGRAQQILALQNRVKDLEQQLSSASNKKQAGDISLEQGMLGKGVHQRNQDKNQSYIHNLERERKEALEKLNVEHELLQNEKTEVKKKLESSKARNQILSTELKSLKNQLATLTEKGRHDNELIDALLKQQAHLQTVLDRLGQKEGQSDDSEKKMNTQDAQRYNQLITQLKQVVKEREEKVQELEQEIKRLRVTKQDSRDTAVTNIQAHLMDKEEGDRSSSARLVSNLGHRLVETTPTMCSRNTTDHRDESEAKCSTCAAVQVQCSEFKALCQAANVEKDGLLELTKTQQKREVEVLQKYTAAEQKLQDERRRCVALEQQLERLKLDPKKTQSSRTGTLSVPQNEDNLSPRRATDSVEEAQLIEFSVRLSTQQKELDALRSSLKQVLEAKEDDLQLYTTMISQIKQVFLQALRKYKQSSDQET